MFGSDYRTILERLIGIYARGFENRTQEIYATTAADYAEVIETISREFPAYDYSEAVGQLLCYMTRLFRRRKSSWKEVYEHILSIPDSIEAKQLLNRAFFMEIQEWAEAGVENLFAIRRDLYRKIGDLGEQAKRVEREIEALDPPPGTKDTGRRPKFDNKIVDLRRIRRKRLIGPLERELREILDQKASEENIAGLIESDIREFEEKLRATRRAYFIRSV
jgi:hypothetical protein